MCKNTFEIDVSLHKGKFDMCDVKKYSEIYKEIAKLDPDDTLQLVLESENEEEKDFYEMIGDYLLQKRQKEVIEGNLF